MRLNQHWPLLLHLCDTIHREWLNLTSRHGEAGSDTVSKRNNSFDILQYRMLG